MRIGSQIWTDMQAVSRYTSVLAKPVSVLHNFQFQMRQGTRNWELGAQNRIPHACSKFFNRLKPIIEFFPQNIVLRTSVIVGVF